MKGKEIETYLKSEEGMRNAERFIKALKEHRIIASVKHVSQSGMSRDIFFGEVQTVDKRPYIYQFNWFLKNIGYRYNDSDHTIKVGGCGMDMVFSTIHSATSTLEYYGFKVPQNYAGLADDYLYI